jgi:hypothetical protein
MGCRPRQPTCRAAARILADLQRRPLIVRTCVRHWVMLAARSARRRPGAVLGGRDGFDAYPDVSGIYGRCVAGPGAPRYDSSCSTAMIPRPHRMCDTTRSRPGRSEHMSSARHTPTEQLPLRSGSSSTTLDAATPHSASCHRSAACNQPVGRVHLVTSHPRGLLNPLRCRCVT